MRALTQPWYVSIVFSLLTSMTSSVEVGKNYTIRVAIPSDTQPAGWYLDAHRSLSIDRESTTSTRVSVHKVSNAYWAGKWMFEQGSSSDRYKIKLISSHQGQYPDWYLESFREGNISKVLVTATSLPIEWIVQPVSEMLLGGDTPIVTYRLLPSWASANDALLTADRNLADSRSATSSFAMVHGVNQSRSTEWLLEPACDPKCSYDEGEGGCHISRTYTASVVRILQGGNWKSIIEHLFLCEEKGKSGVNDCLQTPGCEIDSLGRCAAAASWSKEALVALPSDEGLGIGEHQKCGLFGQLMNLSKHCALNTTTQDCQAQNPGGSIQCNWNNETRACEMSPGVTQSFLFENFREELAYVSLRRLKCVAETSASTCGGDCEWSEGRCSLHPMRSLLAVLGQTCPLSHYFKRQMECNRAVDQFTCTLILGVDGLSQCRWTNITCEPYSISMELDILLSLGLRPSVQHELIKGNRECREITNKLECTATCAVLPVATPGTSGSVAANRLAQPLYMILVFLLPVVIFF